MLELMGEVKSTYIYSFLQVVLGWEGVESVQRHTPIGTSTTVVVTVFQRIIVVEYFPVMHQSHFSRTCS